MDLDSAVGQLPPLSTLRPATCSGSVAAEFALVAPIVLLITVGIADFGVLAK